MRKLRKYEDDIKLAASSLAYDETSNDECPVCKGKKFYVTRIQQGILYCCHRASCGIKGFVSSMGSEAIKSMKPTTKQANPYTRDTTRLPDDVLSMLCEKFNMIPAHFASEHWRWNEETQRVIQPIYDERGYEIGVGARAYPELGEYDGPKEITYWNNIDCPKYHYPRRNTGTGTLVLVEDRTSANRLSYTGGVDCVALLGTHMSADVVAAIASLDYPRVVIALDDDARDKAISMVRTHGWLFQRLDAIFINGPDLKDMTPEQLEDFVSRVKEGD